MPDPSPTPLEYVRFSTNDRSQPADRSLAAFPREPSDPPYPTVAQIDKSLAKMISDLPDGPSPDVQSWHMQADYLLCNILYDLGYTEAVAAFRALPKLYPADGSHS